MWVLTPIIRAGASQRPSDSASGDGARSGGAGPAPAATPNVNHFLTSGPLVIGRAGAGRSIDITIHGDGSVSGAHATLQLEAGPDGRSTVVITDTSSFGTHVNDKRLTKGVPTQLADGDVLRLADRSKFRVIRAPLLLHYAFSSNTGSGGGGGGGSSSGSGNAPGVVAAAEVLDLPLAAWGPDITHCVVDANGTLGPGAASALLSGVHLVAPSWLAAICSQKVWSGSLPSVEEHAPLRLLLEGPGGASFLDLQSWRPPPEDALSAWALAIPEQDLALCDLADLTGAERVAPWLPGSPAPSTPPGRTLLCIMPGSSAGGVQPPDVGAPCVSTEALVYAAVTGDATQLRAAADAYAAAQPAGQDGGTQGTQGTLPGGGTSSEEDGVEETTLLQAMGARRQRGGPAAPSAIQRQSQQAGEDQLREQHQQQQHAAASKGRSGRKRGPSAEPEQVVAPPTHPAGEPLGSKRRRQSAGPDVARALDVGVAAAHAQQQEAQGGHQAAANNSAAAAQEAAGATADVRPPVLWAELVVASTSSGVCANAARGRSSHNTQRHLSSTAVAAAAPNYKAFRRKGQPAATTAAAAAAVPMEVFEDERRMDADAQALAKEEQQRIRRMKKADELFNANIRPVKGPPPANTRT